MHASHSHPKWNLAAWLLLSASLPLFLLVGLHDMPRLPVSRLWDSAGELSSMVLAMLVFVTAYKAMLSPRKGAVVLLGIGFLGAGLLIFLHLLVSFQAQAQPALANTAGIYELASLGLSIAALWLYALLPPVPHVSRGRKQAAVILMALVVALLGSVGLLWPDHLPDLQAGPESVGAGRAAVMGLLVLGSVLTAFTYWHRRHLLARECIAALCFAAALLAVSTLFLALSDLTQAPLAHVAWHGYRVFAFMFLLHATFHESLLRPLEQMEAQRRRESMVLNASPDGILWVNEQGNILMANPAMQKIAGYAPDELLGKNVSVLLPPNLTPSHQKALENFFSAPFSRAMGSNRLKLRHRDGALLPVDISLGHWEDDNGKYAIAYIRDLREREKFEESLRHQATHDDLTGLPNRWLFKLQLTQALSHAKRTDRRVAVVILDLDSFKMVNDNLGQACGDELLTQVSTRMRSQLRENDSLARLSSDEFAIFMPDLEDSDEALVLADRLLAALDPAYELQTHAIHVGCSIGLAFFPDDATDSETLIRHADSAMHQAKLHVRGGYACYAPELDLRAHDHMMIHTRLKEALRHRQLQLHYQPQVDIASGRIVGAEALLRWHDVVLGVVPPSRFVPVAETSGLITALSDWVLESACRQIAAWSEMGTPVKVAVNFSAHQFRTGTLPQKVANMLTLTGAPAHLLEIEITESVAMSKLMLAHQQLKDLVKLGCSIALDDFGTGYSSLAYLKHLPISKLKIDRSFIQDLPAHGSDVKIIHAIIALAHSLKLTVLAEGVETLEQLAFLQANGCMTYQGWLYAKALPAAELTPRLQRRDAAATHTPLM